MLVKFAVKEFIEDREFRNLSKHSIKTYTYTLNELYQFCIERGVVNVGNVTAADIKAYLMYCKNERGNNPTSLNHKLRNAKAFFNYLEAEEIITSTPTKKMQYLKTDIDIQTFTEEHINQMLTYYRRMKRREKSFYSYRDYLIIIILLGSGIRLGELVSLKWDKIDLENGSMGVMGKARKLSAIPLAAKLRDELKEYKMYCQHQFGKLPEFVITNIRGGKSTENGVKCIFKRLQEVLNLEGVRVSPHTFRHTFASTYIKQGGDAFSLQQMLRHSDLATTRKYVHLFGGALASQNQKFNPLNQLNI